MSFNNLIRIVYNGIQNTYLLSLNNLPIMSLLYHYYAI